MEAYGIPSTADSKLSKNRRLMLNIVKGAHKLGNGTLQRVDPGSSMASGYSKQKSVSKLSLSKPYLNKRGQSHMSQRTGVVARTLLAPAFKNQRGLEYRAEEDRPGETFITGTNPTSRHGGMRR